MESTQTQPVYIPSGVNELYTDQCSFEDEWQHLEQFWGEEKYRLQDVDGQVKPLSSSLEEHLLNDDYLIEPQHESIVKDGESLELKSVKGEDIKDIPTTYITQGFRPQELVVIGTYVDKDVIPGFRYKVRKNLTEEYLFDGKAKYLESVGLGYGKRLTFEGDSLNENENYFWSDSRVHGYGFLFQTIEKDETFNILDTKTGKEVGRVIINNPAMKEDVVLNITVGERGYVEKEVKVQFSCDVILNDSLSQQKIFMDDVTVKGKAVIVRDHASSKSKINQIFLDEFVMDSCLLLPEE